MSSKAESRAEGVLTSRARWKSLCIGSVGPGRWGHSFRPFGLGSGDPVSFVDCCPCLHCPPPGRSVPSIYRVDLQLLQGGLQCPCSVELDPLVDENPWRHLRR
ncbi:unnamed protein product [Schistocephalus solidus]|uniref:Uncharacterized protein n=1 Tax=Schistocephalus solidus TaxID=70667 RepID=A0A183STX4_SCHSO|nr:unnamed protein product [Schistocephalus solidus]